MLPGAGQTIFEPVRMENSAIAASDQVMLKNRVTGYEATPNGAYRIVPTPAECVLARLCVCARACVLCVCMCARARVCCVCVCV